MTLHDGATDVRDEDVRQALARVRARLLSERARLDAEQNLLASEQRQQERWRRESPSTDALYTYIVCLADTWLHSLVQPVNTAVGTSTQLGQLQEKWQAHAKTARLGRTRCRAAQAAAATRRACGCRGGALRGGCRAAAKCAGGQAY